MAKKKRPRFGNPARQAELEGGPPAFRTRASTADRAALEQIFEAFSNRSIRSHCDRCNAPVEWLTVDEAEAVGMDLEGGLEWLGPEAESAEVWRCTRCDNFGIVGAPQGEIF